MVLSSVPTKRLAQRDVNQSNVQSHESKSGIDVKLADFVVFAQQLAAMLNASLPILTALETIREQIGSSKFKNVITKVMSDISGGASLSSSLRHYPGVFPPIFVSMVEAGEASGALAEVITNSADFFANYLKLIKKIKSALVYPLTVLSFAMILVGGLLKFVVPMFASMFASMRGELPLPTRILLKVSNFLQDHLLPLVGVLIVIYFSFDFFLKTQFGRRLKERFVHLLPIFGSIAKMGNIARFCRTLSVLLKGGVPVLKSLQICATSASSLYIEEACITLLEGVERGEQLSDILKHTHYFPHLMRNMVGAGEKTGNIDGMIMKVADFYENEINNMVNALTALMEPLLIVGLGLVIGSIVVAMFLPIIKMSSLIVNS